MTVLKVRNAVAARTLLAAVGLALGVALIGTGVWYTGGTRAQYGTGPPDELTLGIYPGDASLLIALADSQGFFTRNGLHVTLKEYESGLRALGGLLQGEVAIATVAEYPFVASSFAHPDLRIIASIATIDSTEVVARRDRGIAAPADLKGKRIAVVRGTILDFFMKTFLAFHHLAPGDVTFVDLPPGKIEEALVSGQVDAAIIWDLYLYAIKQRLGENAVSWPAQSGQDYYWLLVGRQETIRARPETTRRLLRAMVEAEQFAETRKEEAQAVLITRWNRPPDYIRYVWQKMEFSASLPQGLLTAMENEAREQLGERPAEKRVPVPNYLDSISLDALQAVHPKGITLFR